jgi:hypothetical protein
MQATADYQFTAQDFEKLLAQLIKKKYFLIIEVQDKRTKFS